MMGADGAEFRLLMIGISALAMLGMLTAIFPVVNFWASVFFGVLFGLGGLAVIVHWVRVALQELRFRAEMRELDRINAARRNQPTTGAYTRPVGEHR